MQWRLVSSIRKVLSPYENWSQARMIDEILSNTSCHCYLGNKYLIHAFSYSIQPLVGCILAWNDLFQKYCGSWKKSFLKWNFLLYIWVIWEDAYDRLYIYIIFHDSPITNMPSSNLLHINSSKSSCVQYWWICEINPYLWYLLPFSKHSN